MKLACFVGTAREDLAAFPETARRRAGYELFMVQVGREPADFKPCRAWGRAPMRFACATKPARFG